MDEAQYLADEIALIAHGRIVAHGSPDQLVREAAGRSVISFTIPTGTELESLPVAGTVRAGTMELTTPHPTRDLQALTTWAVGRGLELDHLTVTRPTLEDVYLQLTSGAGHG